ncbi:hypothetical protein IIA16_01680, partial [bacterium]|nr:hypothetical protein [bacterium]
MLSGLKGLMARFLPQKKPLVLDTSSPLLLPHEGKRECGACTACCKWLGVTGFADGYTKEPGQECRHVGDSGCAIYA